MPELQPLRQLAHGDTVASGETLDGQQCLVLLRGHAGSLRGLFAEMKELAERVPESGQLVDYRIVQCADVFNVDAQGVAWLEPVWRLLRHADAVGSAGENH